MTAATCVPVCVRPCRYYTPRLWGGRPSHACGERTGPRGWYQVMPCRPMFASVPAAVTRDGVTRLVADCYADLRTAMAANAVARDVQ